MAGPELVDAYLEGRIVAWRFVSRLLKAGISVGTAVAFTALLPSAAQSGELTSLKELVAKTAKQKPHEAAILERLLEGVMRGLVKIDRGGSEGSLGRSLAMLSLNVANHNINNNNADLNFNGNVRNVPVNVSGNLVPGVNVLEQASNVPGRSGHDGNNAQNFALDLGGTVGQVPVNLNGFVNVNVNGQRGPRGVNLNISGNVGDIQVNLDGGPLNQD